MATFRERLAVRLVVQLATYFHLRRSRAVPDRTGPSDRPDPVLMASWAAAAWATVAAGLVVARWIITGRGRGPKVLTLAF